MSKPVDVNKDRVKNSSRYTTAFPINGIVLEATKRQKGKDKRENGQIVRDGRTEKGVRHRNRSASSARILPLIVSRQINFNIYKECALKSLLYF